MAKQIAVRYTAVNKFYTRAFGCLLPSGNADQFPHIRKHLAALRVEYLEIATRGGGCYFIFPETERRKLPAWEGKRFLPASEDGQTGHSVYHITVFQIAAVLETRGRGR